MKIQVYEIEVSVALIKTIAIQDVYKQISFFIDETFIDTEFAEMHKSKEYKMYNFSSLSPTTLGNADFQMGKIYTFRIRSISKELVEHFVGSLSKSRSEYIQGLTARFWKVVRKHMEKIYSLSPVLIKNNQANSQGYWRNADMSLDDYINRIMANAYKKYQYFTGDKANEDCELFTHIEFNNKMPIAVNYKGIKLLCDKLDINIADNEQAQEIAYLLLGVGVAEGGSRGMGYVNPKWL
jgi:Uncharacterized protein predicted to be involved in DNA repair (RAMP superfamily)